MAAITTAKAAEYYEALLNKDSKYVGIFFVGVKTTSVFCIATCRARKPKKKNVVFYSTYKEALTNGFRPCKICKPTENAHETPAQVTKAIELVKGHPKEKISDEKLREEGISPDLVRRWFKKTYHITFHAFQRMYRINNAYKELKDGKKTSHAAYDLGYESLSGFGYTYKKLMGKSPTKSKNKQVILINRLTTPIGSMFIGATEQGLCLLEFTDRKMLETEFRDLQKALNAEILIGENKHIQQGKQELQAYFNGERTLFEVPLHTPGTPFQQAAWKALLTIPYGTTTTYQNQAEKLNKPNAARAVARANGFNRLAIIVPCHRIIGKNGNLTGYGGGIERKQWLIEFERKKSKQMTITAIEKLETIDIAHLVELSVHEGFHFLERLVDEWRNGTNQFKKANECLYIVKMDKQIVAIGGINACPYTNQEHEKVGRIRRVYVHPTYRRKGLGRQLMAKIIGDFTTHYEKIILRTPTQRAATFYESIGFTKIHNSETHTHQLLLQVTQK